MIKRVLIFLKGIVCKHLLVWAQIGTLLSSFQLLTSFVLKSTFIFWNISSQYVFSYVICFRIIHFYFYFHSARIIFDVSSGFYFWNLNRTPTWHLSQMFKVAFKDVRTYVSTKNSEPTYWTILFVMLKIYFIYKVAGNKNYL